jgi:hypothetical protein
MLERRRQQLEIWEILSYQITEANYTLFQRCSKALKSQSALIPATGHSPLATDVGAAQSGPGAAGRDWRGVLTVFRAADVRR